ncbi:hypothetical protein BT96DRAFT_1009125 [Gymnopus androsaceus JB14]|uniref:Uncharacterized protein n=1 Tax=Gymnopus androsaceus JB14 TaxID=1447944 RepID=A0A6A4GDE2_9AGAR|nr:hypothetical protein BT96DRAFT_1009125 [Gymnopus androsaceus JB14]
MSLGVEVDSRTHPAPFFPQGRDERIIRTRVAAKTIDCLALGKKKAPAASISTAHIAVGSSHATSSTTRRNQLEEQHIAVMGGQEAVGTSQASSLATKAQLSLHLFREREESEVRAIKGNGTMNMEKYLKWEDRE